MSPINRENIMPRVFPAFLIILGWVSLANGLWMMLHAWSWFEWIPGVSDTGEANAHFIHDVGIAYAVCGLGLIWCARNLSEARPVFIGITLFNVGHALGHVIEISIGQLPPSHWLIDLPLVFLPSALLGLAALPNNWARLTYTVRSP